jgi:hypothetical protein
MAVAGMIANDCIRMRCCIVQEEVDDDVESGLSRFGLGGSNGANGN